MPFVTRSIALAAATALAFGLTTTRTAAAESVGISPPGANDWSCKPSASHPYPVVLVPGTFESMAKNWVTLSPYLKDSGYCVFALNYGNANGVDASGPVADSARELAPFVDAVLAATGTQRVDLVGHSQGGMMPRYYMGFLGGAAKVHQLVGIADQATGSPFLTRLNSIGDLVDGPSYTVISTRNDEVVTPYTSQALAGPANRVTNLVIQDKCPTDPIEHDQAPNDPVVQQLVGNALAQTTGPADPAFQPTCA